MSGEGVPAYCLLLFSSHRLGRPDAWQINGPNVGFMKVKVHSAKKALEGDMTPKVSLVHFRFGEE